MIKVHFEKLNLISLFLGDGCPWIGEWENKLIQFLLDFDTFFKLKFKNLLAALHGMWDLRDPGMEPTPAALAACSRNHWASREVPGI